MATYLTNNNISPPVHVFIQGIHPNSVYLTYLDGVEYCLIYKDKSGNFLQTRYKMSVRHVDFSDGEESRNIEA